MRHLIATIVLAAIAPFATAQTVAPTPPPTPPHASPSPPCSGAYLDFNGEFADGKMVLAREALLGNGKPGRQRMTSYNIEKSRFDWDWETLEDGGKTWTLRWRINYTRKGA